MTAEFRPGPLSIQALEIVAGGISQVRVFQDLSRFADCGLPATLR